MFLLVGLGNPGSQYQHNRHNVGFMAVDAIASAASAPAFVKKDKALVTDVRIDSHKVILIKPQTFMNLSGPAIVPYIMLFKVPLENCIVFHDELDLPFGKVRVKSGGGSGGHNGLKSLDQHIGKEYTRVRIGIDRPPLKDMVSSYVLNDFKKDEMAIMEDIFIDMNRFLPILLKGDSALFMTRLSELK
jgi:PTH1 family peptidyl-tRNA hydrolase